MPLMYLSAVFSSGLSGFADAAELSGPKCFVRYSVATSTSLSSNWAPYPTILTTSSFHAPWLCFRLITGFRLWQLAHRSSRSFLPSPSGNSCGTAIDRVASATVRTSQIAVLANMRHSIPFQKKLSMRVYAKGPHKQTARSGVTPKRAEVLFPKEGLVSHLRHDVTRFVDFAIRTLRHKSGVGSCVEPQRSRRHHPRFHEHIGVFDGDFVKDFIALTREFLHDVHVGGMEEASSSQPRRIDKRDGVEHQRVALPVPHGISHVGGLDRLPFVVLAVVGWNHAKLPVSAAVIARRVQHGDVVRRMEDAAGRALPRESHW